MLSKVRIGEVAALSVIVLCVPFCSRSSASECTREEARTAENIIPGIQSWDVLHKSFVRYSHCDDGAVGEGFDDVVMTLLSRKWRSAPQMFALVNGDLKFKKFMLDHISATGDPGDIRMLKHNAKRFCPRADKLICEAIIGRAETAIEELK